ncbi:MAG TPA: PrgI family protein [Candidatus Saccharimonadia bacterium]|nr:PrgI family protein [Candidatus Saccharimonadia bacterium]
MATYKVLQDIEAEDKLVGPLTLRQFIYAGIGAVSGYLGFLSAAKHAAFMLVIFFPVTLITGFFAFPWRQDQPTEVWALAKIRFMLKPRKRIWNQSGTKELVTVTAPKKIEHQFTNGLNQDEVKSRLSALANTIDSRGWAIKNVNVSMAMPDVTTFASSDRLIQPSNFPQEVSNIDVRAADDILDETANPIAQNFSTMIAASSASHHQQILAQMQQPIVTPTPAAPPTRVNPTPTQPPADYWFLQQPVAAAPGQATFVDTPIIVPGTPTPTLAAPQAATPTAEEEALVSKLKQENSSQTVAYGHLKTLKTPEQLRAEAAAAQAATPAKPVVTPQAQAAIMNLANNDDLDVATIARQAHKEVEQEDDGEVVISLH